MKKFSVRTALLSVIGYSVPPLTSVVWLLHGFSSAWPVFLIGYAVQAAVYIAFSVVDKRRERTFPAEAPEDFLREVREAYRRQLPDVCKLEHAEVFFNGVMVVVAESYARDAEAKPYVANLMKKSEVVRALQLDDYISEILGEVTEQDLVNEIALLESRCQPLIEMDNSVTH